MVWVHERNIPTERPPFFLWNYQQTLFKTLKKRLWCRQNNSILVSLHVKPNLRMTQHLYNLSDWNNENLSTKHWNSSAPDVDVNRIQIPEHETDLCHNMAAILQRKVQNNILKWRRTKFVQCISDIFITNTGQTRSAHNNGVRSAAHIFLRIPLVLLYFVTYTNSKIPMKH
jgi:hypothetical protein